MPAGVFTSTLKLPAAGIMEEVMLAVTCVLPTTVVARVTPLKITTDAETKWLPVAVSTKLDGNCEKTTVAGEIESRTGTGRALPQRGLMALHPSSKNPSTMRNELPSTVRNEVGTTESTLPDSVGGDY